MNPTLLLVALICASDGALRTPRFRVVPVALAVVCGVLQ